jgi:DNA-binding transcriptional ArsR family regulator
VLYTFAHLLYKTYNSSQGRNIIKDFMSDKGQSIEIQSSGQRAIYGESTDFVLEKSIFSNIFNKDIRRVFVYKKAERLAKVVHLIAPAFASAPSLRDKIDAVAVGLIDSAILAPSQAREGLGRELLTLSSLLAIGRVGGLLSPMNADLVSREAHDLLQETAAYEEPRLSLESVPTLAELSKALMQKNIQALSKTVREAAPQSTTRAANEYKGHIGQVSDKPATSNRREAVLAVLRAKGPLYIKDVSTVIRDVSEKTIQRELQALVEEGVVTKTGERRWTSYKLAS